MDMTYEQLKVLFPGLARNLKPEQSEALLERLSPVKAAVGEEIIAH